MSDTEENPPPPAPLQPPAPQYTPAPQIISFPSNFPVPSAMGCRGDLMSNWEFFKQQWQDYEVATGLDQKNQSIRLATFRSVIGKKCLQIFLNLNCGTEELTINSALKALEDHFLPKRNVVYERYVFIHVSKRPNNPLITMLHWYIDRRDDTRSTSYWYTR